jgi:hypothetical protein
MNPAAPAQANGRPSGCHFCILPRRGSLLEPAAQLPDPLGPGSWRGMCVMCTSMSHVPSIVPLAAVQEMNSQQNCLVQRRHW